jgi:predicted enzyme related to lactoylglutathione lyase
VPVKLVFEVASIEGLHTVVTEAGGQVDPSGTAREFRGRRLLDCLDPEGNVVQLRQPLPAT